MAMVVFTSGWDPKEGCFIRVLFVNHQISLATMITLFIPIRGTIAPAQSVSHSPIQYQPGRNILRITVRTLAIRSTDFALMLVPSWLAPKASGWERPQPTRQWIQSVNAVPCFLCFLQCLLARRQGWGVVDVLRARKRSSERTAMALMRRMMAAGR